MLTRVDPPLDGPVILFQDVIEVLHRSMPAILGESASGFELCDGGRIRGVAVGVDHPRRRMVRTAQRFCSERSLRRIHRPVEVTPLALDPDVGQSPPANCRWSV